MKTYLATILLVLYLVACGQRVPSMTSYKGIALPPPADGHKRGLPPAWLIVGDQAVAATYGSYTKHTKLADGGSMASHGDSIPPQMLSRIATALLAADEQAVIVIGSGPVQAFQARVGPWSGNPMARYDPTVTRVLQAAGKPVGGGMVFTLKPTHAAGDQLLLVAVTFENGDDTEYFWRLNPTN